MEKLDTVFVAAEFASIPTMTWNVIKLWYGFYFIRHTVSLPQFNQCFGGIFTNYIYILSLLIKNDIPAIIYIPLPQKICIVKTLHLYLSEFLWDSQYGKGGHDIYWIICNYCNMKLTCHVCVQSIWVDFFFFGFLMWGFLHFFVWQWIIKTVVNRILW